MDFRCKPVKPTSRAAGLIFAVYRSDFSSFSLHFKDRIVEVEAEPALGERSASLLDRATHLSPPGTPQALPVTTRRSAQSPP